MSIEDLVAIVTPPDHPFEVGDISTWADIERSLGLTFPADYFRLAVAYGTGGFVDGYLKVLNPFSDLYNASLSVDLDLIAGILELGLGEDADYSPYPAQPGLFPWGRDENGCRYCWYTIGSSGEWPVVTLTREGDCSEWNMTITTFLSKLFRKDIPGMSNETFPDVVTFLSTEPE
jgi:hypothetical protein